MEKNNQAILEQMKVTAQLVDEMISLKILTLDAQGSMDTKQLGSMDTKPLASFASNEVDRDTNEQTDAPSQDLDSRRKSR